MPATTGTVTLEAARIWLMGLPIGTRREVKNPDGSLAFILVKHGLDNYTLGQFDDWTFAEVAAWLSTEDVILD